MKETFKLWANGYFPVTLLAGESGAGKTYACMRHPLAAEGIYVDLEDRYRTINSVLKLIPDENIEVLLRYNDEFDIDPVATVEEVEKFVSSVKNGKFGDKKLIVIDGISEIRRMCAEKWKVENGKDAVFGANAWGQVNAMVRKLIFRLVNYCRLTGKYLIMTTFLEPEYDREGHELNTRKIAAKSFIQAVCDEIIILTADESGFYARRKKSPLGLDVVPINITEVRYDE